MIDQSLELIERRLKGQLVQELSRTGLLFRLFSRVKEPISIKEKFKRKTYSVDEMKMQDLVGFRITTYFSDDLKIVVDLCQKLFEVVDLEYDTPKAEEFKPLRKNMVCRMPEEQKAIFQELARASKEYELIDNTFEIQFRTTLSEGWHEVDHLMRYKCKQDWEGLTEESRMLNGIYASLETNDQALKGLFDDISYHHYKAKKWEAMLRNKLRLRFNLENLDEGLVCYLNNNQEVGKKLFNKETMGMEQIGKITVAIALLFASVTWGAAPVTETVDASLSNRMKHRSGAYVGLLGDPFPTVIGVNLAYNVADFMRATAGFGKVSASIGTSTTSATTIGAGARFMVPGWDISPTAGLSFAYVAVSSDGGGSVSVQNFTDSGAHLYGTLGVDWQTEGGFNLGLGYNFSFKSGVGGMPYVNLGYYIDLV